MKRLLVLLLAFVLVIDDAIDGASLREVRFKDGKKRVLVYSDESPTLEDLDKQMTSYMYGTMSSCCVFLFLGLLAIGILFWGAKKKVNAFDQIDGTLPDERAKAEELRTKIIDLEKEKAAFTLRITEIKQVKQRNSNHVKNIIAGMEKEIVMLRTKGRAYLNSKNRPQFQETVTTMQQGRTQLDKRLTELCKKTEVEADQKRELHKFASGKLADELRRRYIAEKKERKNRLARLFSTRRTVPSAKPLPKYEKRDKSDSTADRTASRESKTETITKGKKPKRQSKTSDYESTVAKKNESEAVTRERKRPSNDASSQKSVTHQKQKRSIRRHVYDDE